MFHCSIARHGLQERNDLKRGQTIAQQKPEKDSEFSGWAPAGL